MTTKRQRPSPEQWAKLDAALEGLRERTPPGAVPPLSREITRRADALRAALASGWRIRDLATFFRETAGIDVSPSTIQTALRRALGDANTDTRRTRAKRPRKQRRADSAPSTATTLATGDTGTGVVPLSGKPVVNTDVKAEAPRTRGATAFGSGLTHGANKRGMR